MTPRKAWFAGLVGAALVSPTTLRAQGELPPALGAGPAGAAAGGGLGGLGGAAAAGPAAAPRTLLSFLGISKANCDACKAHICSSPIGQLLNNGLTGPIGAVSGGLIPPLCPPLPSTAAIAAMPGGPAGAEAVAAKIKQDEADAAARVAAVEYLGTVDCRHWKEAKVALLNALRGDRNECVRWAAAKALNSGCCCSKETIEKLKIVVTGEETDGFPAELSPRVKGAAFAALQNCLARFTEVVPETPAPPPPPPPPPEGTPTPPVRPEGAPSAINNANATHIAAGHTVTTPRALSFEAQLENKSMAQVVDEARQALIATAQNPPRLRMLPTGKRSVFHALAKAHQDNTAPGAVPSPNMNMSPAPTTMPEPSMNLTPVQPPVPDPSMSPGQGVVPTSFVVPGGPSGAAPAMEPVAQPEPQRQPQPRSAGKRSLAEILYKSRNRGTGQ
jgi:hypothetical protein